MEAARVAVGETEALVYPDETFEEKAPIIFAKNMRDCELTSHEGKNVSFLHGKSVSRMISRGNLLQVENGTLFNDNRNYEFFECFSCWKNDFSLYLVTA